MATSSVLMSADQVHQTRQPWPSTYSRCWHENHAHITFIPSLGLRKLKITICKIYTLLTYLLLIYTPVQILSSISPQ